MRITNPTDSDPELAALLGRFGQTFCYLEQAVENAITRLLPLTDAMGTVLLSANPLSRNLKILEGLLSLPETQVPEEWREKLRNACKETWSLNSDRNRLLHGRIIEESPGSKCYVLLQHQGDKRGDVSSAMFLDLEYFRSRLQQMQVIAMQLMSVPLAEYDLSRWAKSPRGYAVKPYPTTTPPVPQRPKDRS